MWRSFIPNAFSMGNLTFGFFSIVIASRATGHNSENFYFFISAGLCIMIAAIFDGLDGPLARLFKSQSQLGEQLDSLADLTTFGLAPGFLMYKLYLYEIVIAKATLGTPWDIPVGMAIAAIFPLCAAFRLARFNVAHDPGSFVGLPSPVAGLLIAFIPIYNNNTQYISRPVAIVIFVSVAFLMISNIKYTKPQSGLRRQFTILRAIGFIAIISLLIYRFNLYFVVFGVVILYVASGLFAMVIHISQKLRYKITSGE
ncbi:MAG: CDP-alcohol phosphatidyltransferase family protein [Spirochaetes bacterium]|nr:CDP-alcohol phosphatidyltransferase family protein [Spirochaetota bacterium]MBX3723869.1 CDP-alcohol phosphatidyltransferase family protein [Turneriella sp.]